MKNCAFILNPKDILTLDLRFKDLQIIYTREGPKLKPSQKYTKLVSDLPEESFTLPSYMYTDLQFFETEKEKIFYKLAM